MGEPATPVFAVSGILFGFLFAAFWWTLNRELSFDPEARHFKLGTGLLLASMLLLGVFGIVLPFHRISQGSPLLLWPFRGIVLTLLGIYGYMFVELGHYRVYQKPKYVTTIERVLFWGFLALGGLFALSWLF